MTPAERSHAKAKARLEAARHAQVKAHEIFLDKMRAAEKKLRAPYDKAHSAYKTARAELTRAELALSGIIPMQTIVLARGKAMACRIRNDGYATWFRVNKDNRPHKDHMFQAEYFNLKGAIVTDRVLVVEGGK